MTSLAAATQLARRLTDALSPVCERVEVVGSVRRKKSHVGDIDLLVIKRRGLDLFGEPDGSPADDLLVRWAAEGRIIPRNGCKPGWKHASFSVPARPELKVELYACEADNWGLWLAIRTGPPGLSRQLVTPSGIRTHMGEPGLVPPHFEVPGEGFRLFELVKTPGPHAHAWRDGPGPHRGCQVATPEEADVWAAYGLPAIEPEARGIYSPVEWPSAAHA